MTFKHVKFQDSVVMRSLEKVAREKGLVKQEDLVKTAAPKTDLAPTGNLLVNLLKLSAGLRESGFEKQADEIEQKAMAYKKAQSLYEAHKEKGEDLIDFAHPKGSHKLEDVDNEEAVFETIVEQHLKSVQMVNKQPTGKLASSNDILGAVRVVLGQDTKQDELRETLSEFLKVINTIDTATSDELTFSLKGYLQTFSKLVASPTVDNIKTIKERMSALYSRLNPTGSWHYMTFGSGGLSEDTWSRVKGLLVKANVLADKALSLRQSINEAAGAALEKGEPKAAPVAQKEVPPAKDVFETRVSTSVGKINSYKAQISADLDLTPEQKASAIKWLDGRSALFTSQLTSYNNIPNEERGNAAPRLTSNLDKLDGQLKSFYDKWIA